jgi:tetratricopeptide (TPR) repeat protein
MSACPLCRLGLTTLFFALPLGPLWAGEESKDYPPRARERYTQGQEFEKKGQWKEAIEAYQDAIRLGMKDFPRAHLYRARSNLRLKDYDSAIAQYSRFIEEFGLEESCRY